MKTENNIKWVKRLVAMGDTPGRITTLEVDAFVFEIGGIGFMVHEGVSVFDAGGYVLSIEAEGARVLGRQGPARKTVDEVVAFAKCHLTDAVLTKIRRKRTAGVYKVINKPMGESPMLLDPQSTDTGKNACATLP